MSHPNGRVLAFSFVFALGGAACSGTVVSDTDHPTGPSGSGGATQTPGVGGQGGSGGASGGGDRPAPGVPPGGFIDTPATNTGGAGGTATQCTPGNPPATPRLVRLTRMQYENSIRDLTGLDVRPSKDLPDDPIFAGFDRGLELEVGEVVGRVYRDTAETVAQKVATTPAALAKVVGCDPKSGDACAATFVAEFGKKVFRRPLGDAEKTKYVALFKKGPTVIDAGDNFARGVQVVVEAMFQSPNFLYRYETATKREGALIALGSHEIAARLAFTLTNSTPDAMLLAAADKNELVNVEAVATHAKRLIDSPAGKATLRDFHAQWMDIEHWADKLAKDPAKFPGFGPALLPDLQKELQLFVEDVAYGKNKGLRTLLTAPYTYVTRATAPFYGLKGTFGTEPQRVDLDPTQRAGILTQLGFLASHSFSNQSSPIHRGAFLQRHVLCTDIPAPQEQVPALPPPSAGKTNREVVAMHTAPQGCNACHQLINPVGFGLESFDAAGQWRTMDNGKPVDASGTLAGTTSNAAFDGPVAMVKAIAEQPEARRCYAQKWWRYAYGRSEAAGDACAIGALADRLSNDGYSARDLLVDMVRTKAFMYRTPEGQ